MTRSIFILFAALALLCLSACGKDRAVYPGTVEEVHSVLAEIDELPPVFGSNEPDHHIDTTDPSAVAWVLTKDSSEIMRFTAKLEPADQAKTRVTVELTAPTDSPYGDVDQKLKEHKEVGDLYLTAMREQIGSKLEGRPFDITRTYGALAAATAANIGNISREMDAAAEADQKREEQNIRKAYADEAGR